MTGPLQPPSSTGVRIAGDRYQWLVAWGACVDALLDAESVQNPVLSVGLEVSNAGNLDDVVLYRARPPNTYKQVKYSVDLRTPVNTEYLIKKSPKGGPSILEKTAKTWKELTTRDDLVELAIVTNRHPDPKDPLIAGRDARTRLLVPKAASRGSRSAVGLVRAEWASAVEMSESDLLKLLGVLEFDLGQDQQSLEDNVQLSMAVTGLRRDDAALDAGIDWVAQQVIAGHRKVSLDEIRDFIESHKLRVEEAGVIISIAALSPDPLAEHAVYSLDWVDRFDGADAYTKRRPLPPADWQELQADIEAISSHIGSAKRAIITGNMRLAPAFTVGTALRMVTGMDVAIIQRGELWRSDARYAIPATPTYTEYPIDQGDDLAVGIQIATPMAKDVIGWISECGLPVRRLIILGPDGGPRDNAVSGAEDACALAIGIRDRIRREVKGHPRLHLFLAGPMGLAFLLGNRWNRVAPTVVYEDLATLGYEAAFTVSA